MIIRPYLRCILFGVIFVLFFPCLQCHAEQSATENVVFHARSRDFQFYHDFCNIQLTVVDDQLIALLTERGWGSLITTNKLFVLDGNCHRKTDSFWGNYVLLGGESTILISKIRSNFINHLIDGAELFSVDLNGNWEAKHEYVSLPYYAYVDNHLLLSKHGESRDLQQWNEMTNAFDTVLKSIDLSQIHTHDTLLCLAAPSESSPYYSFWIPSKMKVVNMPCEENVIISDFIYADNKIYWSNMDGIYRFCLMNNTLETVVLFNSNTPQNTYFYMNGNDIFFTTNGSLTMYNTESKKLKQWECCPSDPNGFFIVNDVMYSCTPNLQIQYVHLLCPEKQGIISLNK